jgi:dihydrofolate reductase
MRITLVVACSIDGYITDEQRTLPTTWTSQEDAAHFKQLLEKFPLQVMGRSTYESHKPRPIEGVLKVILTHNVDAYNICEKNGSVEFRNFKAKDFVAHYKKFSSCLVLGGSYVYTDFLEAGLVDEVFLTVEPIKLDSGIPFLLSKKTLEEYGMHLKSSTLLNSSGTTLNHYILIK